MRQLDGFTDSMDMNFGQLQEMVRGRRLVCCSPGGCRVGLDLVTEHTVTSLCGPAPRGKGPGWGPHSASAAAAAVTTALRQAGGSSPAPTALLQAVAELRAPTVPALPAKERQPGGHTLGCAAGGHFSSQGRPELQQQLSSR